MGTWNMIFLQCDIATSTAVVCRLLCCTTYSNDKYCYKRNGTQRDKNKDPSLSRQ
jgi:hypothetical protein